MSPRRLIAEYERWLDERIATIAEGRRQKHRRLRESPFAFLRGAYPVWLARNADMAYGPLLLAIGDLHVDNFGTWRTAGGDLGWGVNDLDEAAPAAAGNDLVRLAASAILADDDPPLGHHGVADALLHGYRTRLAGEQGPAAPRIPPDGGFWRAISALDAAASVPEPIAAALGDAMPSGTGIERIAGRIAGLGSRDHPRWVAVGGKIVLEAKLLSPPAIGWLDGEDRSAGSGTARLAEESGGDATLHVTAGAVIRRLAPDCGRVELADVPRRHSRRDLLCAMGAETARLHLASLSASELAAGMDALGDGWLAEAAQRTSRQVEHDWRRYRDAA